MKPKQTNNELAARVWMFEQRSRRLDS